VKSTRYRNHWVLTLMGKYLCYVKWKRLVIVYCKDVTYKATTYYLGGFKFEAQRAWVIDGTPLRVFWTPIVFLVCYLICFESF
jgi:hypothetical protein